MPGSKQQRAEPLPPEDRRRAIVEAVIPLLVDRGATVTTREMAEAAGVAEGTIFKVFPDKKALILEALRVSFDAEPALKGLSEIYRDAPLELQLAEAARVLLEGFEIVIALVSLLRTLPGPHEPHPPGPPQFVVEATRAVNQGLAQILKPHRERLRLEPARAASVFRGLLLASNHPTLAMEQRLTVDELVGVFLNGVAVPAETVG